jgi:hypothetical protein
MFYRGPYSSHFISELKVTRFTMAPPPVLYLISPIRVLSHIHIIPFPYLVQFLDFLLQPLYCLSPRLRDLRRHLRLRLQEHYARLAIALQACRLLADCKDPN